MKWKVVEHSRNKHAIEFDGDSGGIFMCSDLHWDNPKCDRKLLKQHFNRAKELGVPIFINGDFFCAMQARGDKRGSKDDIRPEHNKSHYLDSLIDTAVEWFEPYKENLCLIGYGNHETSVYKHRETDLLKRFVKRFNGEHGSNVNVGGYGGHLVVKLHSGSCFRSYSIKYFHGSGGGGPVTKGVIQNNRMATYVNGVDCIHQGHVHNAYSHFDTIEVFNSKTMTVVKKNLLHLRTPTYKEEYEDQFGGWHVERGAPPKPLGGCYLDLKVGLSKDTGSRRIVCTPQFWLST